MYETIIMLAAGVAAFGVLVKAVMVVFKLIRRVGQMADDFLGVPESSPGAGDGRLGVIATLHDQGNRLDRLERAVLPNGGGSIADGVAALRRAIEPERR